MKSILSLAILLTILTSCSDENEVIVADAIYLGDWSETDRVVMLLKPTAGEGETVRVYLESKYERNVDFWNSKNLSVGDTVRIKYIISHDQKDDLNILWPGIHKHIILLR